MERMGSGAITELENFKVSNRARLFSASHPHWSGPLVFDGNSRFARPEIDYGSYDLIEKTHIVLNWDNWEKEELAWNGDTEQYKNEETGFSIMEIDVETLPEVYQAMLTEFVRSLRKTDQEIHAYGFEGLCNRINVLASAMATGKEVVFHWAVNEHCPARFEDLFQNIAGVSVINEDVGEYSYMATPVRLCWFYPKNVAGLDHGVFRERVFQGYRVLLEAMKAEEYALVPKGTLALCYRHHFSGSDNMSHYLSCVRNVFQRCSPGAVHVVSDHEPCKNALVEYTRASGISVSYNTYPLLNTDFGRSLDNVLGMCRDLLSMRNCSLGVLSGSTRSTIPDCLRAYGVKCYYTYHDSVHRTPETDDLLDLFSYRRMLEGS